MLDGIRRFLRDISGAGAAEPAYGLDDPRLAVAALLVHVVGVDGVVQDSERATLASALAGQYGLGPNEVDELIAEARAAFADDPDLGRFAHLLRQRLDRPAIERVVEMLWEAVLADGRLDEIEDAMVWRLAEMLGLEPAERLRLRETVEARERSAAETG